MAKVCWPYFDPEYENLSTRINPPRVSVDNTSCSDSTLIKVDSMNKPGILLEVVQILTDLDLTITKAYISSDGGWFMDAFHVTDHQGKKITDLKTVHYIEKALGPKGQEEVTTRSGKPVGVCSVGDHTSIELTGRDRPGLLSEISAVLASLHFNVVAAEVWTHNRRIACVVYVNDDATSRAVDDPARLSAMEDQLKNILRGCGDDEKAGRTSFSIGFTHVDRRLHQMLFADRDYEGVVVATEIDDPPSVKPKITVERCEEKGYSMFFHAAITSDAARASQEYYIRHMDGCVLDSEGEKDRVIKCLEAAIRRRVSESRTESRCAFQVIRCAFQGLSLELCAKDRVGLLSEVTRILRENGLSVSRAGVMTIGGQAMNVFYVRDASGNPVDMKIIEALRKEIGQTMMLNVKKSSPVSSREPEARGWARTSFFFGNLLERFLA
ncbi:hypothetical protein OIU76_001816 [Salix suchowensis]|nr:hypothetical protein OIU76_001816 [Salix suchowensis]